MPEMVPKELRARALWLAAQKLTAQVQRMREERAAGAKLRELATAYGVALSTVSRLCAADAEAG